MFRCNALQSWKVPLAKLGENSEHQHLLTDLRSKQQSQADLGI